MCADPYLRRSGDEACLPVGAGQQRLYRENITVHGLASHAGGSPDKGINALYAAMQALQAVNALRETFRDDEHIRFHPIITEGG